MCHIANRALTDVETRYEQTDYESRHIRKRESDIPIARAVNKSDEKLQTFVSEKGSSDEYLCRMAREDKDYKFLKEVIQNNLWKKQGKDQRIERFLGVASDLSIIGEFILYKGRLTPLLNRRRKFVEKVHKIGHSGETRTLKLLQEKIWFLGIAKLCKDTVKNYSSCQATHDRTYDEPLQSTPFPPGAWHTIAVDFNGPFKDGTYAIVGYNLYSRYTVVSYCRSTAFSCVKPILESWFSTFGTVNELKSDRGPPFNGHEFGRYAHKRGFIHKHVKPRHPRGNGEAEKFMQNLKKMERIAKQEGKKHRTLIEGMLNAYHATPHPATGKSPYELMFGRKMRFGVLPEIAKIPEPESDGKIRRSDVAYKLKSKRNHDRRSNVRKSKITVGDRILMNRPAWSDPRNSGKDMWKCGDCSI